MLPGSGEHHETQVVMYHLIQACTILTMMTVGDKIVRLVETKVYLRGGAATMSVVRRISVPFCPHGGCEYPGYIDTLA